LIENNIPEIYSGCIGNHNPNSQGDGTVGDLPFLVKEEVNSKSQWGDMFEPVRNPKKRICFYRWKSNTVWDQQSKNVTGPSEEDKKVE
jgi:hypothetical protein